MLIIVLSLLFSLTSSKEPAQYTAVFLNLKKIELNKNDLKEIHDQHLKYLEALKENKNLEFHGTFENGGEFLFFHSTSLDIRKLINDDPAVEAGIYRPEFFVTHFRYGKFCDEEKAEIEKHNFIRYTSHITKYNVQHVPQLLKSHDDYLRKISKTGNVLAEGVFINSDGGFMIIKGNLASEVIINDPTVAAGFNIPEIKDIWVSQGSLCQ